MNRPYVLMLASVVASATLAGGPAADAMRRFAQRRLSRVISPMSPKV
jgi:hypothetical protein